MMELRLVKPSELETAVGIVQQASAHLRAQGIDQWQGAFCPSVERIQQDISEGKGFALVSDGVIAGYIFIDLCGDPVYDQLGDAWQYPTPCAALHRVAISDTFRGRGYASCLFTLAAEYCRKHGIRSLRIDTHAENRKMQHVLSANGFSPRGTVRYTEGLERIAFERCIEPSDADGEACL